MRKIAKRDLTIEQQLARGPLDLPYLALVLLLTAIGLVMLLSASYASAYYNLDPSVDTGGNPYYYFLGQLKFAVAGVVGMYIVSKIDYQWWRGLSVPALAGSIFLLILVFTPLGRSSNGARRWLDIGFSFQPSELVKVAVILFFAARLSKRKDQSAPQEVEPSYPPGPHGRVCREHRPAGADSLRSDSAVDPLLALQAAPHVRHDSGVLGGGGGAVRLGHPSVLVCGRRRCRGCGAALPHHPDRVHDRPYAVLAQPRQRPAGRRLSAVAVPDCHWFRRPAGHRAGQQPSEVHVPPRGAQRLCVRHCL